MKAKHLALLLPLGMSLFPGLLASQDSSTKVPFYQKEFGKVDGNQPGNNSRTKDTKKTGGDELLSGGTKKPIDTSAPIPGKNPEGKTLPAKLSSTGNPMGNPESTLEDRGKIQDRIQRLNLKYQEELQTLLDGPIPANSSGLISPTSENQTRETEKRVYSTPRRLDAGFQAQDWPNLVPAKSTTGYPDQPEGTGKSLMGPTKTGSNRVERDLVTAGYAGSDEESNGSYAAQPIPRNLPRNHGDSNYGQPGDTSIVQVQGQYQQGNGYPNSNPNPNNTGRQVIRTQPQGMIFAENGQGQGGNSRRTNGPVQANPPETQRSRPNPGNADIDFYQRDLETLKTRYLNDLRTLNLRYQEEASLMLNGPIHDPGQRGNSRNGPTLLPNNGQRTIVSSGTPSKPTRNFDFFWLPRMFTYFKPTLPFARMNQDMTAVDPNGVPQGNRLPPQQNQAVRQTNFMPTVSQPETRKPGQPRQSTRSPSIATPRQENYPVGQSNYQYEENNNPPMGPRNSPRQNLNSSYQNQQYQDSQSGINPPRESYNRPGSRMQPVQNQQQGNGENNVRTAGSPPIDNRLRNQVETPERMPQGVPLVPTERQKIQQSIEQLHRKYQEELKALLKNPPPSQDPEDQVWNQSGPGVEGADQAGASIADSQDIRRAKSEQKKIHSVEDFLEIIQTNSMVTPEWAKGDPDQKRNGSKDGMAQIRQEKFESAKARLNKIPQENPGKDPRE